MGDSLDAFPHDQKKQTWTQEALIGQKNDFVIIN
jgi:hypothetical protein